MELKLRRYEVGSGGVRMGKEPQLCFFLCSQVCLHEHTCKISITFVAIANNPIYIQENKVLYFNKYIMLFFIR